jgi:hypothetical protein
VAHRFYPDQTLTGRRCSPGVPVRPPYVICLDRSGSNKSGKGGTPGGAGVSRPLLDGHLAQERSAGGGRGFDQQSAFPEQPRRFGHHGKWQLGAFGDVEQ